MAHEDGARREEFPSPAREKRRRNAATDRPGLELNVRRLRDFAGLAAAIVPFAIVVHLVAEAAAIGREGVGLGFIVRHGYFGVLVLGAASWFGATVGLGRAPAERRRRCALLRAELDTARRPQHLWMLIGANVAFFAATQAVEGVPIASGAMGVGFGVALAGSLLAALAVFSFGSSLVAAGLDSAIGSAPFRRTLAPLRRRDNAFPAPRHASTDYSLFIPNRPPPAPSQL